MPPWVGDGLWLAGIVVMAGVLVLLACSAIVSFGTAGRDESMGDALACLVSAALAILLGRWLWGQFNVWKQSRSRR
jgi:hypothetical protein